MSSYLRLVALCLSTWALGCSADGESVSADGGASGAAGSGSGGTTSSGGGSGSGSAPSGGSGGTASGGSGGTSSGGGSGGTSSAGGSGGTSSGGGAGGSSSGGSGGSSSGGSGGGCVDPGPEPNDSLILAISACGVPTCDIGDCNNDGSKGYSGSHPSISGVIGPNDSDHFRFDGKDKLGLCQVDATAKTKDSGFRLCIFAACAAGATKVSACPGGLATETEGAPGCCVYAPNEVKITYDCSGSPSDDDSARITVRVDEATSCKPYVVDYHF
ncbi:MAG: hypothetical protein U0263_39505 [Polyangiaceae bacterium]